MNLLIIPTSFYTEIMSVQQNVWIFDHFLCSLFDAEISGVVTKTSAEPSEQQ